MIRKPARKLVRRRRLLPRPGAAERARVLLKDHAYAQILELERTKFQVKQFERAQEHFRWAAVPAIALLLLELALAHTRLRVLP